MISMNLSSRKLDYVTFCEPFRLIKIVNCVAHGKSAQRVRNYKAKGHSKQLKVRVFGVNALCTWHFPNSDNLCQYRKCRYDTTKTKSVQFIVHIQQTIEEFHSPARCLCFCCVCCCCCRSTYWMRNDAHTIFNIPDHRMSKQNKNGKKWHKQKRILHCDVGREKAQKTHTTQTKRTKTHLMWMIVISNDSQM